MITFLDENDVEYGALATIKATNAVNGERSLTGTIVSGDYVLSNIERGWRLRFDDEYYVVTYAKPTDEGRDVQVTFDAVHQFFWDFDKSSVYDQLTDGSHTFVAYLDFIFKNSGYSYTVDSALNVYAFEKQSFGLKKRLTLFNDIITSTGVEFQVNGKVVRILEKVGTDLSTIVRKNFNMNELTIEKNIGDFVTYQKGYGAYFDEENHSKGRLVVEYTSPLASVYGKLEAEPFVDERYTKSSSMLAVLKENVDNSYTISVSLDMEDLTRAGYKYKQPIAGDYIMAINETLDFQEKIRIVSFTSEYDVQGILVKHEVTCNDIGTVKKLSASYNLTKKQASSASATASNAYSIANKALVSADGKNTNYYSNSFPIDNPKGTLKTGDLLFLTVGDTVKQYYWNGADWITNPVVNDVEAFKEQITEELKEVPDREEFEATISEKLAISKAEIETQIDTAKTQAESNAKAYADEINQTTAEVAEQANTAANSLKSDLAKVKTDLTTVTNTANSAKTSASEAKQQLTAVANDLSAAKQDLQAQASQLTEQASAQSELTKRVSSVEETANGTKTTVSELSKTVDDNTKNITSVTARTKVVEDDLLNTKTTLSQVQTTANSASQKTATLETGLNGLSAKFSNLRVGGVNLIKQSTSQTGLRLPAEAGTFADANHMLTDWIKIEPSTVYTLTTYEDVNESNLYYSLAWYSTNSADYSGWISRPTGPASAAYLRSGKQYTSPANAKYTKVSYPINYPKVKLECGNVATDYSPNEADIEQKVAEYKQNAEQNYANLQSTVQTLDGTVKQNKSEFEQTASQIKSSISAVEGKIPTNVSTRNLILKSNDFANPHKQSGTNTTVTSTNDYFVLKSTGYTANAWGGMSWNMSISEVKAGEEFSILMPVYIDSSINLDNAFIFELKRHNPDASAYAYAIQTSKKDQWFNVAITFKTTKDVTFADYPFYIYLVKNGLVRIKPPMLVRGNLIPSDYQPAFEDTESDISQLNTTLTQTATGLEQLSTQVTSQGSTITSHTNSINSLSTGLSTKVSQTDFNTLSGRVTTAENNITAKANELSSKITSVEGKIPTAIGGRNLYAISKNSGIYTFGVSEFNQNIETGEISYKVANVSDAEFGLYTASIGTSYSASYGIKIPVVQGKDVLVSLTDDRLIKNYVLFWGEDNKLVRQTIKYTTSRFKVPASYLNNTSYLTFRFGVKENTQEIGTLIKTKVKIEYGSVYTDWTPAPEDYDSKLASVQSEIKQTTDAINASVSSLDKSTVKNTSLTINTDGIVMKAGKSTTDVANAIGSYFAVNQNAINLFSDKINVKGSMIVDGAITSAKIASKSINTAHLNGKIITADVIATGAITADAIKTGAITTDKMSANSINGDRITAGTLDAAKIKAGSITASQIASGTITSSQIKAGGISAANIATGAITTDKIAAGAINADKIAANAITADMITGGKLKSTNGATVFDLNGGTLTFNNNYGYIQRVASDKIFEITTLLYPNSGYTEEHLTSAFNIRKSDNSRRAGVKFTLYNTVENKPTAEAKINADALYIDDSKNTTLFSVHGKSTFLGTFNLQGWGDIPVAQVYGGLLVKDIGIGGHTKSLLNVVEELCKKANIIWF